MEHEVYVPFSASAVRAALAEPARVARLVPGLQPDTAETADAPDGRLRLRIGGSTITYRGTLAIVEEGEGFSVEGEGTEARGSGTVHLLLTVVARPVPDSSGATLAFSGSLEAEGRLTEYEPAQREAAGRRLLDRFTAALIEDLEQTDSAGPAPRAGIGEPDDNERAIPGIPAPEVPSEPDAQPVAGGGADADRPASDQGFRGGVPDAEIPPPSLDPEADLEPRAAEESLSRSMLPDGDAFDDQMASPEADIARRTMIGRSAEEVDHAPPRGRYAPVPGPGRGTPVRVVLRWAAPAAVVALASAVLVGRALRHRR